MLAGFQRTGNTLTRRLMEEVSGLALGSVMSGDNLPNISPQYMGFKGDRYFADNRVWVYKTHLPLANGFSVPDENGYRMGKVVVTVRNPVDAIVSFLNMCATFSHTLTVDPACMPDLKETVELSVREGIEFYFRALTFWKHIAD